MKRITLLYLLVFRMFFGCSSEQRENNKDKESFSQKNSDSTVFTDNENGIYHQKQFKLKISAFLIYEDGTLSDFDVLQDKSVALWNVVSGGGSASKPSDSTEVRISGDADSSGIKIRNGKYLVIDTLIYRLDRDLRYSIKNTGCSKVFIIVVRINKQIYRDTIPFHCGE